MPRVKRALALLTALASSVLAAEMSGEEAVSRILNSRAAGGNDSYEESGRIVRDAARAGKPLEQFVLAIVSEYDDHPKAAELDRHTRKEYLDNSRAEIRRRAETRNDPFAWYVLSVESGDMKLLERAADGGNVQAINAYASMRIAQAVDDADKRGEEPDKAVLADAYSRLKRASVSGDANAFNNFGLCLLNGYGCEKDPVRAASCFTMAANRGHAEAMDNLSYCYERGAGVEQSAAEAFVWKLRARAAVGDRAAAKWLETNGK